MSYIPEKYAFVEFLSVYSQKYEDVFPSHQKELNNRLLKFLQSTKPSEYRIINAQVIFFPATEEWGMRTSPSVQHILHIAYKE